MKILEVLAWAAVALLGAGSMRVFRPMALLDDGYQYLNVAENFSHGRGLTTSLVHFDTERSHGRIPAPLTTFPPGYPAVLATTNFIMTGFMGDLENAARLVSCVGYAGTAALLAWALILTGVTAWSRQVVLLLFVTNAVALDFATSVLTEPLYMLLSTGAVVGLIWIEKSAPPKRMAIAAAILAYSAAGLAYWVRYAGLFLITAVVGYALVRWFLRKDRLRTTFLMAALIPIAMAAVMMLRNLAIAGTWKGGNDMAVHNPWGGVIATLVKAHLHLMLGQHAVVFGVWETLLLASGLGVSAFPIAAVRKKGAGVRTDGEPRPDPAALLVGLCIAVYGVGMFYAGLRTVISLGTRMFVPILPLYLLALGMVVNRWTARSLPGAGRAWLNVGLALAVVGYAGVNARDLYDRRQPASYEILAKLYAEPAADSQPLLKWVESNMPKGDAILATEGQATGYLLHRPVISMIGEQFSPTRWECDEVRKQMQRFQANYAILYKPASMPGDNLLLTESRFVAASVSGQPPCGFGVAAENPDIRILKITGDEGAPGNSFVPK